MPEHAIEKIKEKIAGMRTTTFITHDDSGYIVGRPMATQEADFDGTVWFMTGMDSKKVAQIRKDANVGLAYGDGSIKYVMLSGTAAISQDKEKIKELWSDFYKAYFKDENDPNIALVEVNIKRAEYWDHPGGKLGAYADMAKSAITGSGTDSDEHEVFED